MSWLENFNQRLTASLQNESHESKDSDLFKAISYSLNHPGKRLRPRFVEEAGRLVNLDAVVVENTAFAIEMVHVFSLVHDDLPCLDNDDLRRGLPTTHKKFGEAQGLLAGDALLSMAFETFAKSGEYIPSSAFTAALKLFSECIGSKGMILGQSLELQWTNSDELTLEQLTRIQQLKTGALFRASILTPLLLAGAKSTDALFNDCADYADAFGFAFQIADDLEDEVQDQAHQKKNMLSLVGRNEAIAMASQRLTQNPIAHQFSNTSILLDILSRSTQ